MTRISHGSSTVEADDPKEIARHGAPHPVWQRTVDDAKVQAQGEASGTSPVQTVVQPGQTLTAIGATYGAKIDDILAANPSIKNADHIEAGQKLTIPVVTDRALPTQHVVQPGESLSTIAQQHQASVSALATANSIANPDRIKSGQVLAIPGALRPAQETPQLPTALGTPTTQTAAAMKPVPAPPPPPTPQDRARSLVAKAQAETGPNAAINALSKAYHQADPAVRSAILADPAAGKIFQQTAEGALSPLTDKSNGAPMPQGRSAAAMEQLNRTIQGLDPAVAGEVADSSVPAFQAYAKQAGIASAPFGPRGVTALMELGSHIHGTPAGDKALQDFASTRAWNPDAVRNSIAAGADPAYAIAIGRQIKDASTGPRSVASIIADGIGERDQAKIAQGGTVAPTLDVARRMQAAGIDPSGVVKVATDGAEAFKAKVGDDVTELAKHDAELAWLVKNDGPGMTGPQLQAAITDYRHQKGPAWQADEVKLKDRITDDGTKLIGQLAVLGADATGHANSAKTLSDIVNDPSSALAISTALKAHPDLAKPSNAAPLVNVFTLAKVGDVGRKMLNEYAAAYVRSNVLNKLQSIDLTNPESVAKAKASISALDTGPIAKSLGVAQSDLGKALAEVEKTVTQVAASPDQSEAALADLQKTLTTKASLAKAFNKTTFAGQTLRTLAFGFAGASLLNSVAKARDNPRDVQNDIKAFADAAGVAQKASEIALGRSWVSKESLTGGFGGEWKALGVATAGDLLTGIGVALDVVSAVRSFRGIGMEKDPVSGTFYSISAGGGGLALASTLELVGAWAGPVGLGIAAAGVVGNLAYSHHKEAHQYEGSSARFLQAGGFGAAAAHALSPRDGIISGATGAAQVPFLERYGQMRGLSPAQMQHWVNSLTPAQVDDLASLLLQTAGDSEGDPAKFGNGPLQTTMVVGSNGPPENLTVGSELPVEVTLNNTLGVFERNLASDRIPRP